MMGDVDGPRAAAGPSGGYREAATPEVLGIISVRGLYFVNFTFRMSFLPILLHESPNIRASESQIGGLISVIGLASAAGHAVVGGISDRLGAGRVAVASCLLISASYLLYLAADGVASLYVLGLAQGALIAAAEVSMMMQLVSVAPAGRSGLAMGLYAEAENVAGIAAGPALGNAYAAFGAAGLVGVLSASIGASAALAYALLKKKG
jgi:predicted MFS family arabinose efflux permease